MFFFSNAHKGLLKTKEKHIFFLNRKAASHYWQPVLTSLILVYMIQYFFTDNETASQLAHQQAGWSNIAQPASI